MEYAIYNEIKYTTLQIRSILVWKEMTKKQQNTDANPPRGDGEWARKSLFKKYFFINSGYNIREMIYQKLLGPYTGWNQDLTIIQKF